MNKTTMIESIREKAASYAPAQLELLKQFASMDSETNDIPANEAIVEIVKKELAALDVTVEEVFFEGVGKHVIARICPEGADGKIILNSHLDTVFPAGFPAAHPWFMDEGPAPGYEKNPANAPVGSWLHGLGVTDDKGGFVVSCYAVRIAQELGILPKKEICMIYACDEEQGSITGQKVYEKEAAGAECAFIFEGGRSTNGNIELITSRKGVILGAMDIKGVEAHAGSAYLEGHSAVKELAHKILELYSFNDYEKGVFYNAAPVKGGRPNGVVAGDARMEFCVAGIPDRESFAEAEANVDSMGTHTEDPYCSVSVTRRMLFPALERTQKAADMVALAAEAGKLLGEEVVEVAVPSASDANYFSYFGCPAVDAFGPIGSGIHTTEEALYVPSIQQKTELFATMLYLMKEGQE